jgi:hypothetical protein
MKRTLLLTALFAASPAFAGEGGVDILPYGYVSQSVRAASAPAKTRAQVAAETLAAARLGLLSHSEADPIATGQGNSPAQLGKTRAQVAAETREAARLGLLEHREDGSIAPTAEQESQIRRAGLRAIAIDIAR